jgi:hypothetical protein
MIPNLLALCNVERSYFFRLQPEISIDKILNEASHSKWKAIIRMRQTEEIDLLWAS